ncbi:MAG: hypothetical protein ACR2IF_08590 [Terriglobales bacterium]
MLRTTVGIVLVALILVIVVSPYVDLPLTALRSQQVVLWLLGMLALVWETAVMLRRLCSMPGQALLFRFIPGIDRGAAPGVACALLC